jgi:deoxyhypusine synthase
MKKSSRFLHTPVEPFSVEGTQTADDILRRMERTSFQGRNLATARRVWEKMLRDDVTIFLGMAGALSAGGMRLIVAHLIAHRMVDCLVSTGANLYHDLHETRGQRHFQGSPLADDAALARERIDRVYDTFAREEEFIGNDNWIASFAATLERRPYTTREFLHQLGGHLWRTTGQDGILTAAYRAKVPIFCPAIADSSVGMGLSQARHQVSGAGQIDVIGDIVESANLVIRRPRTASVVLGGGTPKNFINQACVQAEFYSPRVGGHLYALQIVTDVPHFGGASGSTLEEAQSWGKLAATADRVTVHADATLALPILATALADSARTIVSQRQAPAFTLSARVMTVDGEPVPGDRFVDERTPPRPARSKARSPRRSVRI